MANRVIRDGLIDSESVASLHDKTFRLYIHMLLATDDYGLLPIDYGAIRRISPMLEWTREMVAKMLGELVDAGLIMPYDVAGKSYAAMSKSKNYIRSIRPKHPIPPFGLVNMLPPLGFKSELVKNSCLKLINEINETTHNRDTLGAPQGVPRGALGKERKLGSKEVLLDANASRSTDETNFRPANAVVLNTHPSTQKGVGEKSEKKSKDSARATRLPSSWALPLEWGNWAMQERPELSRDQVKAIADKFHDYWLGKAGKDGAKLDWFATWRNWVRNERSDKPRTVTDQNQAAVDAWKRQHNEKTINEEEL